MQSTTKIESLDIIFIMPSVGRKKGSVYVKTWQMEPLALAVLSSLTPSHHNKKFFDDRLEQIDYAIPADLVVINVETYTARRAYQIAQEFRSRGAKVIMGGFHPTLVSEEVATHADAILVGPAEKAWGDILADFQKGNLKKQYKGSLGDGFAPVLPDRTLYDHHKYLPLTLVETGRGCKFDCEFCSVCAFFEHKYLPRPLSQVVEEVENSKNKICFFIDDNLGADRTHLKQLLSLLIPLKIKWVGQISIDICADEELLGLMRRSGCVGVLIGFESLDPRNLKAMGKGINRQAKVYEQGIQALRRHRIILYATFLFGYDHDTEETFKATYKFALKHRIFLVAFNHLVPFPGTPLYKRMETEGRLLYPAWWLEPTYRFGQVAFIPKGFTPEKLEATCLDYRRRFYNFPSLLWRSLDFRANLASFWRFTVFWTQGIIGRKDVERRQGLSLGEE